MKTIEFPSINHSPEVMLQNVAREMGDKLTEVLIIGYTPEGEEVLYTTSTDLGFLALAQLSVQNLAIHAMRGEVAHE